MSRKALVWLIVVATIVAVVGGASLIVAKNSVPAGTGVSAGFIH